MINPDDSSQFPTVSQALIESLESVFPYQDFAPNKDYRQIDFHYGQR